MTPLPRVFRPAALLACAWIILLLPAVLFSQWFTLDVGGLFTKAADYPDNLRWAVSPRDLGGRFFPAYWYYNFLVFALVDTKIGAHFALQGLAFIGSLAMTCYLFFRVTRDARMTVFFGIVACLGGAVAENMYTLGKAEWLAYLFVIGIITLFHTGCSARGASWISRLAAITILVALAMWSKETSMVLLAFGPAALLAGVLLPRELRPATMGPSLAWRYAAVFAAIVAGLLLSRAPRVLFSDGGKEMSYIDYDIDAALVGENLLFYVTQQPDTLLFGLMGVALFVAALRRARTLRDAPSGPAREELMFVGGLLAMGWGYYVGLLIWRWPMGYYMLLPSILFKFVALYGLSQAQGASRPHGGPLHAFRAVIGLSLVYALLHSFYIVTSQIGYSRMYTEAITRYVALSRPGERLVIESFPFYAEQVTNTRQVIALHWREERGVGGIADVLDPAVVNPEILKMRSISRRQLEHNENSMPRKGDYVLFMTGNKLATWFVRGVTPHYGDDSQLLKDRAYDMMTVAENRTFAPGAFVNLWTFMPQVGNTYIGYKLYRVETDRPRIMWRGRYPDGWTQKVASVRLFPEYGRKALITMSTPDFNSPNEVTVTRDGLPWRTFTLHAGSELAFEIENTGPASPLTLDFRVKRTSVPKDLELNRDKRDIGILLRVEPRPS